MNEAHAAHAAHAAHVSRPVHAYGDSGGVHTPEHLHTPVRDRAHGRARDTITPVQSATATAHAGRRSESDDDFVSEDDTVRTTRQRLLSSARKPSPLRDDRPSMARRSSKKAKRRLSTYQSPSAAPMLTDDAVAHLAIHSDESGARVQLNHVLFEGERSELSSETDKEPDLQIVDVDNSVEIVETKPAKKVLPANPITAERIETPIEFTLTGAAAQAHKDVVRAPRKPRSVARGGAQSSTRAQAGPSHLLSGESSTRKRGRQLASLFRSDSEDVIERSGERVGSSSKRVVPDPPAGWRVRPASRTIAEGLDNAFSDRSRSPLQNANSPSPPDSPRASRTPPEKQLASQLSTRKRRRIINLTSDEEDEEGLTVSRETPKPVENDQSDEFHTPVQTRRLPSTLHNATGRTSNSRSAIDIDEAENAEIAQDSEREDESTSTPEITRRGLRLRSKSQMMDVTPSQSASPPSTRRKGRLGRLQTHTSSDADETESQRRRSRRVSDLKAALESRDVRAVPSYHAGNDTRRPSQWYDERDIDQFSSSSAELVGLASNTNAMGGQIPTEGLKEMESGHLNKGKRVGRTVVKEFSDEADDEKDDHVSVGDTPTQSPPQAQSGCIAIVDEQMNDDEMDIVDLIADDEEECIQAAQVSEDMGEEAGAEEGPPPFDLNTLCEGAESIEQMVERMGETYVMELVSNAQKDGRRIVGGEELGLDDGANVDDFTKFSNTVVASDMGRIRPERSVTEQALRGEFKFNYRGREQEGSTRRGGKAPRGRGRGRGFRRWRGKSRGRGRKA